MNENQVNWLLFLIMVIVVIRIWKWFKRVMMDDSVKPDRLQNSVKPDKVAPPLLGYITIEHYKRPSTGKIRSVILACAIGMVIGYLLAVNL